LFRDEKSRDQLKAKVAAPLKSLLQAIAALCGEQKIDDEHMMQHK
jgi:hypothetical protein